MLTARAITPMPTHVQNAARNVESEPELARLSALARDLGATVRVALSPLAASVTV